MTQGDAIKERNRINNAGGIARVVNEGGGNWSVRVIQEPPSN